MGILISDQNVTGRNLLVLMVEWAEISSASFPISFLNFADFSLIYTYLNSENLKMGGRLSINITVANNAQSSELMGIMESEATGVRHRISSPSAVRTVFEN